jgi:hypothetical protein
MIVDEQWPDHSVLRARVLGPPGFSRDHECAEQLGVEVHSGAGGADNKLRSSWLLVTTDRSKLIVTGWR